MTPTNRIKVSLLGDTKAGKTALVNKVTAASNPLNTSETIGGQFNIIKRTINDQTIPLQCWDIGCAKQYLSTARMFSNNSNAYIIAIDLTRDAITQATKWIEFVNPDKTENSHPIIILVGTKHDLVGTNDKQVQALSDFAKNNHKVCIITSAKDNENIDLLFTKTAQLCLDALPNIATERTNLTRGYRDTNRNINNSDSNTNDKTLFQKLFSCCK
jgi:small GTP-binding protein